METHAPKAVFISYAREDAASGRRIAEALRSSGIEVWFDENELRGGDAWDQKIRRQIKDCSLFLAIISAHTQERGEGYFRLEWNLAVERTRLMMEGVPFLVPVVVDETPENTDMVPEPFLRVQWTRLSKGLPSPQFVEQVQRLLALPHKPVAPTARAEAGSSAPARAGRSSFPMWSVVAVGVVGFALVAYVLTRSHEKAPTAAPKPIAEAKAAPAAPVVNDKSIALLPFTNLSPDKENEFFADGVHEDVLTTLQNIREIRVVSRTSVMGYRGTTKNIRDVAKELGVAYILEGSVRRAGNSVRVTGQLIDARTDAHLWANQYDRELTAASVFAIQTELAQSIAAELKAALSPEEKKLIERRLTENLAAYDLYLKARGQLNRSRSGSDSLGGQERNLQSAVTLDPEFAEAWGELGRTHAAVYFYNIEHTPDRLAKAKEAIDRAVKLAPGSPEVIRNLGNYWLYGYRDYARATEQFKKLLRVRPNDPEVLTSLGDIQRRQAMWVDALGSFRRATQLDRANIGYARNLASLLQGGRRWSEYLIEQQRIAQMLPNSLTEGYQLAYIYFMAKGSKRESEEFLAGLKPDQIDSDLGVRLRMDWARQSGNYPEAIRLYEASHGKVRAANYDPWGLGAALTFVAHGDAAKGQALAAKIAAELRDRLEREPSNTHVLWVLGLCEAMLGRKEEAMRCARVFSDLVPESFDAVAGAHLGNMLVLIYAWAGETDRAIKEAARLLRTPNIVATVHMMRHDPWWFPLRSDSRFMALLDDPKNNAPLF